MMGLTKRQADCLAAIQAHIAEHGRSPSYVEIAAALGTRSRAIVNRLTYALKERGYIDFIPCKARSITLRSSSDQTPTALPPELQARLDALCAQTGDDPDQVVQDAVDLFIDQFEASDGSDVLAPLSAGLNESAS